MTKHPILIFKYKSFLNDLEEARLALTSTDNTPVPAYRPIVPKRKHGMVYGNTRKRGNNMNEKVFLEWCKKEVAEYTNIRRLLLMMYLWYGVVRRCRTIRHCFPQLFLMVCIMNVHTMEINRKCTLTHIRNGKTSR